MLDQDLRSLLHPWPGYPSPEINLRRSTVAIFSILCVAAVTFGIYFCFSAVKRTVTKILVLVLLPVFSGIVALACVDASFWTPFTSALGPKLVRSAGTGWMPNDLWKVGTGIHFAVVGALLVAIFACFLSVREVTLPLRLSPPVSESGQDESGWRGCKRIIWVSISPIGQVVANAFGTAAAFVLGWFSGREAFRTPAFGHVLEIIGSVFLCGAAIWLMGAENRSLVKGLVSFSRSRFWFVALALPLSLAVTLACGHYIHDRIEWAAQFFGRTYPPSFSNYFSVPKAWMLMVFVALVAAAIVEEIVFRGVIQKFFVSRYGIWRGLLLLEVVWGAVHFPGDKYSAASDALVLLGMTHRIVQCVSLGLVLSWLAMRSGSLVPSVITHSMANFLQVASLDGDYPGKTWLRTALWAVTAYVLFRFWPVEVEQVSAVKFEGSSSIEVEPIS